MITLTLPLLIQYFQLDIDTEALSSSEKEKLRKRLKYQYNKLNGLIDYDKERERKRQKREKNKEEINRKDTERKNIHKENNMKIVRLIQNGDDTDPLRNMNTGEIIENVLISADTFEGTMPLHLHHIHYDVSQKSHTKETDPNRILRKANLTEADILELMSCIPLDSNTHHVVHKIKRNGSLQDWSLRERPYVLRSQENFDEVCQKLGLTLSLSYDEILKRLL